MEENIEEKKELIEVKNKGKKELASKIITYLLPFIIGCTLFISSNIFFEITASGKYNLKPYTLLFTIFFGLVIYSLMVAIMKKTARATRICFIFVFIISIINGIKVKYAGEPLYFSDINFLGKSFDLIGLISQNIVAHEVWRFVTFSIIYAIILEIIVFLNSKFNLEIINKKVRVFIIVIDVIILILLFFPNAYMKEKYLKIFFNIDEYVDFDSYTTNLSFYERNGFINGMYGVALNSKFSEPKDYNEDVLNEMLDKTPDVNTEKIRKTKYNCSFFRIILGY